MPAAAGDKVEVSATNAPVMTVPMMRIARARRKPDAIGPCKMGGLKEIQVGSLDNGRNGTPKALRPGCSDPFCEGASARGQKSMAKPFFMEAEGLGRR